MTDRPLTTFIGPRRRALQWATTLFILLLPWVRPGGVSLLRVDLPTLSLHLFGQILRIEELYLFLFFTLTLTFGFLLMTLTFGRVWCGWGCPQTTLNDMTEWLIRRLHLTVDGNSLTGPSSHRVLLHGIYLTLSLLVAANLLWYFIEPPRFFSELLHGKLDMIASGTLLIVAATVYLDLAFLRRLMCHDFCPYGRFQSALADQSTLTLQRPAVEIARCIDCGACARACPMGIDIRDGEQIACINCGRCLDACRQVMARRNEPGLIRYSFGRHATGAGDLITPRRLLLTGATLALTIMLLFAVHNRSSATLKVAHSHTVASRLLADGQQATFFNLWVNNRAKLTTMYRVQVRSTDPSPLTVKGPVAQIFLKPGENRRLDVVVVGSPLPQRRDIEFILFDKETIVASAAAQLPALPPPAE
ncbi:MAG: 4Fe-4S binding protein [Desulfuromonadaceae bacterium]|nr:4Fe-4S binding protein [Desulfuromonadaceae bacterium]